MKAVLSTAKGGVETLVFGEIETPDPQAGQVRIAVKAAGVNFPDTLIIRDLYQFKPPRPFSPGGEVAGIVDKVGEDVEDFKVGDRVLSMGLHGGFAEYYVADENKVFKIPDEMPYEHAAALLFAYGSSYHALIDRGQLKAGEILFVTGGSGGIGSSAIEIGKAVGAKVIAGVSSNEKADFCKQIGADETLVYPSGPLDRNEQKQLCSEIKALCKKLGNSEGADVVCDAVGGDYAEPVLRAMAWEGRYLVVGFTAGIPRIPLNLPLLKGCQIVGVFRGAFTEREQQANADSVAELIALYLDKKILPRVTEVLPLKDAAKALASIENRTATGKTVLVTGDN